MSKLYIYLIVSVSASGRSWIEYQSYVYYEKIGKATSSLISSKFGLIRFDLMNLKLVINNKFIRLETNTFIYYYRLLHSILHHTITCCYIVSNYRAYCIQEIHYKSNELCIQLYICLIALWKIWMLFHVLLYSFLQLIWSKSILTFWYFIRNLLS